MITTIPALPVECSSAFVTATSHYRTAVAADCTAGQTLGLFHHLATAERVLFALMQAGAFRHCKPIMSRMVLRSADALPWLDHAAFCAALRLRNHVAHRLVMPPADAIREAVAVVASQLSAWGVDSFVMEDMAHDAK